MQFIYNFLDQVELHGNVDTAIAYIRSAPLGPRSRPAHPQGNLTSSTAQRKIIPPLRMHARAPFPVFKVDEKGHKCHSQVTQPRQPVLRAIPPRPARRLSLMARSLSPIEDVSPVTSPRAKSTPTIVSRPRPSLPPPPPLPQPARRSSLMSPSLSPIEDVSPVTSPPVQSSSTFLPPLPRPRPPPPPIPQRPVSHIRARLQENGNTTTCSYPPEARHKESACMHAKPNTRIDIFQPNHQGAVNLNPVDSENDSSNDSSNSNERETMVTESDSELFSDFVHVQHVDWDSKFNVRTVQVNLNFSLLFVCSHLLL